MQTITMVLLAACSAHGLAAADVTLVIAASKAPAVYKIGERIEINAAFSATAHDYCFSDSGGQRDRWWKKGLDEFRAIPVDGGQSEGGAVADPYFDELEFGPFVMTIKQLSSVRQLSQQPRWVRFDLNEWVRITAPWRYRISLRSSNVSRCSAQTPEARRPVPARSNEVEITILPADGYWAGSQLQEIRGILDSSPDENAKALALCRLCYLKRAVVLAVRTYISSTKVNLFLPFRQSLTPTRRVTPLCSMSSCNRSMKD